MKKTKLNILLNIATLCLCVCAIAMGIYSAKQAQMNVGGKIGFNAHNCALDVWGKIEGAATSADQSTTPTTLNAFKDGNGNDVTETNPLKVSGDNTTSLKLQDSGIYFYDYSTDGNVPNIVITIYFKNTSAFPVKVTCDLSALKTSLNSDTSKIELDETNTSVPSKIKANAQASASIVLKLTDNSKETTCNFNLPISFDMSTDLTKFLVNGNDTTTYPNADTNVKGWYIQMGSYNGSPIPWVPVAKQTAPGTFEKFDYTTTQPQEDETYYFMSFYGLGLSGNGGICYQRDNVSNTFADGTIAPTSDYSLSNVRSWLNNKTAYYCLGANKEYTECSENGAFNTFNKQYNLTNDVVYNSIIARSIESLYESDTLGYDFMTKQTITLSNSFKANGDESNGGSDLLWIPSFNEIDSFVASENKNYSTGDENLLFFLLGAGGVNPGAGTKFRTKYTNNTYILRTNAKGIVKYTDFFDGGYFYNPMFQLSI